MKGIRWGNMKGIRRGNMGRNMANSMMENMKGIRDMMVNIKNSKGGIGIILWLNKGRLDETFLSEKERYEEKIKISG